MGDMVSFAGSTGTSEGYLALPADGAADGGPAPAVIVIGEYWGLGGHITALADRFAAAGFVALAPDLYHGAQLGAADEAVTLLMGMAMDQAAREIAGAAAYLAERPGNVGPVGTAGFRLGGSLALWSAGRSEHLTTAVGFYPVLPWERMGPEWGDYKGTSAVVHCADGDGDCLAGTAQARAGIEAAGGECTGYEYPGTRPGFFNDDHPEGYDGPAAATAWARTIEALRGR